MKKLLPLLLLFPTPVLAHHGEWIANGHTQPNYRSPGGSQETKCYENVYREEYVPGTRRSPGYIKKYDQRIEVECRAQIQPYPLPNHNHSEQSNHDENSCIEGSLLGGLAGGAAGGVLATQENWIWSIPTGIIGGAMVGCQIDGG